MGKTGLRGTPGQRITSKAASFCCRRDSDTQPNCDCMQAATSQRATRNMQLRLACVQVAMSLQSLRPRRWARWASRARRACASWARLPRLRCLLDVLVAAAGAKVGTSSFCKYVAACRWVVHWPASWSRVPQLRLLGAVVGAAGVKVSCLRKKQRADLAARKLSKGTAQLQSCRCHSSSSRRSVSRSRRARLPRPSC